MKPLFVLFSFLLLCSCTTQKNAPTPKALKSKVTQGPKNVILLIGDGMGLTQMSAGIYAYGNKGSVERCPVVGLHKAYSSDNLVTDSAAGATAFACGEKTYNGAIAMDPDSMPLPTLLEEAEKRGMATGLIATSSIVHATPASFIAHNKQRKNYEEIASDFLETEVDYFVGGGRQYFEEREIDGRDLLSELRAKGYQIETFINKELSEIQVNPKTNFGYLTANKEPLSRDQGRNYLPVAVKKGLEHLSARGGEDGFFLMIEGSQIDWGGHANEANYVLNEWEEFDQVIGDVLDWSEKDGETLVIVTADHETGGLAIQYGSKMDSLVTAFTSGSHTGPLIPVYAAGPGELALGGIYENTAIYHRIREQLGWK